MPNLSDTSEHCEISDNVYCLTPAQRIGLSYTVEANLISLLAVLTVFFLVFRNSRRASRSSERRKLVNVPIDAYMLSLFSFDFLQALAAVLDIKWVNEGETYVGGLCTAQGIIGQWGEAGSAMTTWVISLYTLLGVASLSTRAPGVAAKFAAKYNQKLSLAYIVIATIWVFLILWVSIGTALHNKSSSGPIYMTPTPYWCWIGSHYLGERIAGEYLWLWLAFLTSAIIYIPLAIYQVTDLVFAEGWSRPRLRWPEEGRDARKLLAYPLAYALIILPTSVIRWTTFTDTHLVIPSGWAFFAQITFGMSGLINVLLLRYTRPDVLLFKKSRSSDVELAAHDDPGTEVEPHAPPPKDQSSFAMEDVGWSTPDGEYDPAP